MLCWWCGSPHRPFNVAGDDNVLCVLKACPPLVLRELGAQALLQLWLLVAETFWWSETSSRSLSWRASCFEASYKGARMEQFH